jgi:CBS domain-containing protein
MARTAADVMERGVITLSPEASLLDAHRLFVEEGIHGAPVVDDEGKVVGVVTSTDLLRAVAEEHESAGVVSNEWLRDVLEFQPPAWSGPEDFQDRLAGRRVDDVMTVGAWTVQEDTPVREVADLMRRERVHRVWVVKEKRPTGVVSTFDLLSLVRDGA